MLTSLLLRPSTLRLACVSCAGQVSLGSRGPGHPGSPTWTGHLEAAGRHGEKAHRDEGRIRENCTKEGRKDYNHEDMKS